MSCKQLEKEFADPSAVYRAKSYWGWNGRLEERELRRQIRIFKDMGLGGFFMHSRVGLTTAYLSDEWFDLAAICIDEAEKTDTEAWLYDEDRWPSGAAGGIVTKDEQYRMRSLVMTRHQPDSFDWPDGGTTVYIFGATFEDDQISWYKKLDQKEDINILPQAAEILQCEVQTHPLNTWYNNFTYLDTMNDRAVARFIEVTHEAYRRRLGEHFGKRVPGIFGDEANCNCVWHTVPEAAAAWTDRLAERFREMFDYDLIEHLPELFFESAGAPISRQRYHYHICKTRMFIESYAKQVGEWCERNGLMYTGHVLGEEPIRAHVGVVGSTMQFYPHMQAPGIDILTEYSFEYIAAKQCVSVARQMGRKWVLSELYGCTGWDTTFETYKHSGDWQAALGITLRSPHLAWYSMAGERKRDFPASIHFQSPWYRQYKFVEDYFSRINVVLTAGEPICELAVIHPLESYYLLVRLNQRNDPRTVKMDTDHHELVCRLLGGHLDFDFVDEHLLTELDGKIVKDETGAALQVGKMKYRAVLVPPLLTIRQSTLDRLTEFVQAGGKVIFAGTPPEYVDAENSDHAKDFAADRTVPFEPDAVIDALQDKARRVSIRNPQNQ